ncbi:bifunctional 3-(3-hydroxy-phenyl)propionate/3-hydroxycinnamic acid hydroxylase [Sphingomonas sp.]|uniref:bifunctional 3-(3-hydroxy-phenyl)propionate/3-hydroxycinnamic acid hydroxylase MhpA n=1 Tax=Sphingomonas sp. TaxID=28214 RepID=UPI0025D81541|nr:bifunctional 3-(3-hydroxy-phenyl)propionate/3-hydroxycinnamic acid hydroxylase [Sphingomonas sp.]
MKDVVIVGAGPVGLFAALLLDQQGLSVDLYERWPSFYPLPRACGVDHEIIRQIQSLGLMTDMEPLLDPVMGPGKNYEFHDANHETLLKIDWNRPGSSGWAQMNMFYQPEVEAMMLSRLRQSSRVTIHHGRELVSFEQSDDHVALIFCETENPATHFTARARYVIGADGARSKVRDLLGIKPIDLGFAYDWLVVDVVPHDKQRVWSPYVVQYLDPRRPTTLVGSGPHRRRWEFMCLPGECVEDLNSIETTWKLLEPWDINPDNSTVERHTVYTFRGSWADQWKQGRIILAGDAAHTMPPFLGQGLCAGMRDAFALSWRLSDIFNKGASDALLESYGPERREHVCEIIRQAVELGRLICMVDPADVKIRDAQMKAAMSNPSLGLKPPPEPRLGFAGLYRITDEHAGYLSVQGHVSRNGRRGLFDDVAGGGWQLLMRNSGAPAARGSKAQAFVRDFGVIVANFGPGGDTEDLDGVYSEWFDRLGDDAVLVRPDYYVFGTSSLEGVDALLGSARDALAFAD